MPAWSDYVRGHLARPPCAVGSLMHLRPTALRVKSKSAADSAATTGDDRRSFAVPRATGQFDGIDLAFLDPNDEADRRILILANTQNCIRRS